MNDKIKILLEAVNPANAKINAKIIKALGTRDEEEANKILKGTNLYTEDDGDHQESLSIGLDKDGSWINYFSIQYENYMDYQQDREDPLDGMILFNGSPYVRANKNIDFYDMLVKGVSLKSTPDDYTPTPASIAPTVNTHKKLNTAVADNEDRAEATKNLYASVLRAARELQQGIDNACSAKLGIMKFKLHKTVLIAKRKEELNSKVPLRNALDFEIHSTNFIDTPLPHIMSKQLNSYRSVLIVDYTSFLMKEAYTVRGFSGQNPDGSSDFLTFSEVLGRLDNMRREELLPMEQLQELIKFLKNRKEANREQNS